MVYRNPDGYKNDNDKCRVKSACLDIQGTKISSMVTKIVRLETEISAILRKCL